MISFIIIGRNIASTIEICLNSVFTFIERNVIECYEVIYVDSNSKDDSLKLASKYNVKIVKLTGKLNAAIGRNEGAKVAIGDILFFIDGDMELQPECYNLIFTSEGKLVYSFLRGNLINVYYLPGNSNPIKVDSYNKANESSTFYTRVITGGLFLISRDYWLMLNGMDNRFRVHEDIDFGLRMAKFGIPQRVYNILMVKHHMISYYNSKRIFDFLFSNKFLFSGMLIRKHFFNKQFIKLFLRSRYSLLMLIMSIILFQVQVQLGIISVLSYFTLQILRTYRVYLNESYFLSILAYKVFYDLYSIIGFLFFYPRRPKFKVQL